MRLGPVLAEPDFPLAELSALRLSGDLFPVGDAFAPCDQVDDPELRAASLHPLLGEERIAVRGTAAWVWGVTLDLARPVDCATGSGRAQALLPLRGTVLGEIALIDDDVVTLAGTRVTSPLRTALDLLRDPQNRLDEVDALLTLAGEDLDEVARHLEHPRFLRERRRARARLADLAGRRASAQPAETRYTS